MSLVILPKYLWQVWSVPQQMEGGGIVEAGFYVLIGLTCEMKFMLEYRYSKTGSRLLLNDNH